MSELDRIKDQRAMLNAATEQFHATMRTRLMNMPADDLYDFARAFGVEPTDYVLDELPDAILEVL